MFPGEGPTLIIIQMEINKHLAEDVGAQIRWNAAGTGMDTYFRSKEPAGCYVVAVRTSTSLAEEIPSVSGLWRVNGDIN
jgi:hypothetical protein